MHILAIDVGERKVGLAVGDTDTKMAFTRPALLVESWDDVWEPIRKLIKVETIDQALVGWPINADGTTGSQAERVDEFIRLFSKQTALPVVKRDERHTSQAVQREQQAAGMSLQRGQEDSLAAQLLLESYLTEHQ